MRSARDAELAGPPRLWRSACLQGLALAAVAVIAGLPRAGRDAPPPPKPPEPPKQEMRRIRVVQLPRPSPARSEAPPAPRAAQAEPARPAPPAPKTAPDRRTRIAVDAQAVQGIRLRVLVPRTPGDLAAHLRKSGGCMVVSRLSRCGAIPEDQMARRAAETGYELTCFAEPTGALRCQ